MILKIDDEIDLNKIMISGQCFRVAKNDDIYRFVYRDNYTYIKQISDDTLDVSCDRDSWDNIWHHYFDLDRNYSDIRSNTSATGFLKNAMEHSRGLRILKQDEFEMLISFIISQRKSIPAIRKSVEYICSNYGNNLGDDIYSFPDASVLASLSLEELRAASLGYRDEYIKSSSATVAATPSMLRDYNTLDDDSLFNALKEFRGVGDKVANCIMLFGYQRFRRVPIDTWIKKIIDNEYEGNNPFPSYGENAGIIQQYAFYYITNQ